MLSSGQVPSLCGLQWSCKAEHALLPRASSPPMASTLMHLLRTIITLPVSIIFSNSRKKQFFFYFHAYFIKILMSNPWWKEIISWSIQQRHVAFVASLSVEQDHILQDTLLFEARWSRSHVKWSHNEDASDTTRPHLRFLNLFFVLRILGPVIEKSKHYLSPSLIGI